MPIEKIIDEDWYGINSISLIGSSVHEVTALIDIVGVEPFLDYVYTIVLKRSPERSGRVYYQQLIKDGMPRSTVVRNLLRSREYRLSSIYAPGLSIDEFINRVYQDVLGRWPDQEGLETYRRIASRLNGRRKVVADLRNSGEAIRKGGGRLLRIEGLRSYGKAGWPVRLSWLGPWFARRHAQSHQFNRIALSQRCLGREVAALREELKTANLAATPLFGFAPEGFEEKPQAERRHDLEFQNALTRARRAT